MIFVTVDVASIDRRDFKRHYYSIRRVESLVEAFQNSQIHQQTLHDITETIDDVNEFNNDSVADDGPSYMRMILTLVG